MRAAGRSRSRAVVIWLSAVLLVCALALFASTESILSPPSHRPPAPKAQALRRPPSLTPAPPRTLPENLAAPAPPSAIEPPPPVLPPVAAAPHAPAPQPGHFPADPGARSRFQRLTDDQVAELARGADQPGLRAELAAELGHRRAGLLTLLALVDDDSGPVRAAAALALRQLADPRAIPRLHDQIRREAIPIVKREQTQALEALTRVSLSPH
jgi:PBS lyase HEAT-like repeat